MDDKNFRIETDSMGPLKVPLHALYGAQTQRAVHNFPISGLCMPRIFIRALALVKYAAAEVNVSLGAISSDVAKRIQTAADAIATGRHDAHFPIDVFQTGSGTSTNMNMNEVIARLASTGASTPVHPNDHVNYGQSSNDAIPTALHVSAALLLHTELLPALTNLHEALIKKAQDNDNVIKTGRTHLMDAMPVRLSQELGGWAAQIASNQDRIESTRVRLHALAQGGTAVGTGINAHPTFGEKFAIALSKKTGLDFKTSSNYFESLSCQDTAVELSGQLRTLAVSLTKISNDLRWMNSGPLSGLGEILLPALQPGSSIMPGKVNPVIPEAVAMVCAQVIGNDTTIMIGGQSGNFQLNVMLPVITYNLLQSMTLLSTSMRLLAEAIAGFTVCTTHVSAQLSKNPILITALNAVIGYEKGAAIAKKAYQTQRPVIDVAIEMTDLDRTTLEKLLDPQKLTQGG